MQQQNRADPPRPADETLDPWLRERDAMAWFETHLPELRREVSGQRILYEYLAVAVVVGLAAHASGYVLRLGLTAEPLGLLADLLYTFGWALWTGAVVVVFTQLLPEAKRREVRRLIEAVEALRRDKARTSERDGAG